MSQTVPIHSHEDLPPIKFTAAGESDDIREAILEAVRPSPGFPTAVILMADAITKRADIVLMDFTAGTVSIRYFVDNIWHSMPPMDRATGDYMLATLKQLADLDYRQRRERQIGQFAAEYLKQKHDCKITSQGMATGERVAIEIGRRKPPLENLDQLGMRPGMRDQLIRALNEQGGMVVFSSLPGDGLSTTWRAAFQSADRFMRDFYVVEEQSRTEPEIINVTSMTYDESKGETPLSVMRTLMLKEPNVVAYTEVPNAAALNQLSELANEKEITTIARIHAKHAVEAVVRLMLLKPDVSALARALRAVVSQRVLRRLCQQCRRGYTPNPNLLARLGLPAERVPVLYTYNQPQREELVDEKGNPIEPEPCENCGGPGYYEQIGFYELLLVDDRFRQAMRDQPNVQKLSEAAQQSGHISLRDEGIVLVAKGITSLEELQRVLKK